MPKTASDFKDILDAFGNYETVVVGDFYLDEYIYTESTSISPEAPVPRAIIKSKVHIPGAAGNVACGFAALGSKVRAVAVLGDDLGGEILRKELEKRNVDTAYCIVDKSRVTGIFSRILLRSGSVNQHVIRLDEENSKALSMRTKESVKNSIENASKNAKVMFVADYDETSGTGMLDKSTLQFAVSVAKKNKMISIGISRKNIKNFENFDIIIANAIEAGSAAGVEVVSEAAARQAAEKMRSLLDAKIAVVTLGKDGLIVCTKDGIITLPSLARKVVDVCGAGDSLSTAFALAHAAGADMEDAAMLASCSAAIAVSKEGTVSVTRQEILDFLDDDKNRSKVVGMNELSRICQRAREENKKLVFTNGYFDMLHAGHIRFLQKARELGDILIVAINSDESVRANKGNYRPLISQNDRAHILAAFDFVDFITVFDELTPIKLIKMLSPDILVKGGTYTPEEVIGSDIMKAAGKKVVIIPPQGPRTEDIIKLIRQGKKAVHDEDDQ